ncbi:MAG: hypothetical protein HY905_04055 [Deltaproteobacteria bacterium]|nr:hypothetical protein [Deltaproteobacteria bacterium]
MGADLCGYILVGPETLERDRVNRARARLRRLRQQAGAGKTDRKPLRAVIKHACGAYFAEPGDFLAWLGDLPASTVTDFAAMWNDGGYRDQMGRRAPGDAARRIIVLAETTGGDGPEEGSAWWLAQAMDYLDLFPVLGIE